MTVPTAIFRVIDRKTLNEIEDPFEIVKFVLTDPEGEHADLSVYKVQNDSSTRIQIVAEHHAKAPRWPDSRGLVDISGLFTDPCTHSPDYENCPFKLWNEAHHEIGFQNTVQSVLPVAQKLIPEVGNRVFKVTKSQIKQYGNGQFCKGDQSWKDICGINPSVVPWVNPPAQQSQSAS